MINIFPTLIVQVLPSCKRKNLPNMLVLMTILKVWAFTLFFNGYIQFNFANFLSVFSF